MGPLRSFKPDCNIITWTGECRLLINQIEIEVCRCVPRPSSYHNELSVVAHMSCSILPNELSMQAPKRKLHSIQFPE